MKRKRILILAVSEMDARLMKKDIEDYATDQEWEGGVEVIVATDPRSIEGLVFDEFVMTEAFASQRSVRMILATQRGLRKGPTSTQKGL